MPSYNEKLKELRLKNGLTLEDVAKRLHTTKATIQRHEAGVVKNVPYDMLIKYASLYGVRPEWLFADESISDKDSDIIAEISTISKTMDEEQLNRLLLYAKMLKQYKE